VRTPNPPSGQPLPGTPKPTSATGRAQSQQRETPAQDRNDSRPATNPSRRCLTATGRGRYPRLDPVTHPRKQQERHFSSCLGEWILPELR
jgi:hypothetical protein